MEKRSRYIRDEEEVVEDALGENLRAREWRLLRSALEQRLQHFMALELTEDNLQKKAEYRSKIKELKKQVSALRQEEAISGFVEASARAAIQRAYLDETEIYGDEE
jgi:cobalamin biosynthesis Co2+ chelatase CbiK